MRTTSWLRQFRSLGRKAIVLAAPLCLVTLPMAAEWYDNGKPDTHANESAARIDPFDPVPGIGYDHCQDGRGDCRPRDDRHPPRPHPILPGILGHNTFLVDCGARHSEPRRGVFNSVDQAADFAPPNATILILPPGDGTTCVETIRIHKPVSIATYGSGTRAVIQAPPREPCLTADIPLGDALTIDGIRFIARGEQKPCIAVLAGHVIVRNTSIDSRTTNWAFDVADSGELTVQSTHVETDGSGVCARRAHVDLHNLDIDITDRPGVQGRCVPYERHGPDRGDDTFHAAAGLWLDRTDGTVDGGSIIGGMIGIAASAGTHGLQLSDLKVHKARTGVALLSGGLGIIGVSHITLSNNVDGMVIAPGAESQVTGSVITDSGEAGITIYSATTLISGNKVVGARDGILLSPADAFPPPYFASFTGDALPGDGAAPIVENNLVANVSHAAISVDARTRFGRVIGNNLYATGHARCIDDRSDPIEDRANSCHGSWLPWPF